MGSGSCVLWYKQFPMVVSATWKIWAVSHFNMTLYPFSFQILTVENELLHVSSPNTALSLSPARAKTEEHMWLSGPLRTVNHLNPFSFFSTLIT